MMMADLPHTLYRHKGNGKPKASDVADAEARMREAYAKKMRERNPEEGYTINEVFEGVADYANTQNAEK